MKKFFIFIIVFIIVFIHNCPSFKAFEILELPSLYIEEGVWFMKKQYVAPELEKIIFDVEDIITHSLATSEGDDVIDFSDWWGDIWGDDFSLDLGE